MRKPRAAYPTTDHAHHRALVALVGPSGLAVDLHDRLLADGELVGLVDVDAPVVGELDAATEGLPADLPAELHADVLTHAARSLAKRLRLDGDAVVEALRWSPGGPAAVEALAAPLRAAFDAVAPGGLVAYATRGAGREGTLLHGLHSLADVEAARVAGAAVLALEGARRSAGEQCDGIVPPGREGARMVLAALGAQRYGVAVPRVAALRAQGLEPGGPKLSRGREPRFSAGRAGGRPSLSKLLRVGAPRRAR